MASASCAGDIGFVTTELHEGQHASPAYSEQALHDLHAATTLAASANKEKQHHVPLASWNKIMLECLDTSLHPTTLASTSNI